MKYIIYDGLKTMILSGERNQCDLRAKKMKEINVIFEALRNKSNQLLIECNSQPTLKSTTCCKVFGEKMSTAK